MSPEVKRIGIGIGDDAKKVLASAHAVAGRVHVICYCRPSTVDRKTVPAGQVTIAEHNEPEEALIADLMAGTIDAAVRGTLPSNSTLNSLKRRTGADHLERIALLETVRGKKFLLAPVGVDEGWTVQEKLAQKISHSVSGFRRRWASSPAGGSGMLAGTRRSMQAWLMQSLLPG
jgi:predicted methyltransferase MtxX (methanogen marker protein 4)